MRSIHRLSRTRHEMHDASRSRSPANLVDETSVCDGEQPGKYRPRLRIRVTERDRCIDEYALRQFLCVVMISRSSEKKAVDRHPMLEISLLHRILGHWVRHSTHSKLVSTVSPSA
jgi:hypothetical protein